MSHLQVIAHLEDMLREALVIIDAQANLLALHGIETADEGLESAERLFREDMKKWG